MKRQEKPSVFISYCHEDTDRDLVNFIYSSLSGYESGKIKVFYDLNLQYGENFSDFMSLLRSVDACIILLTPEYYTKVSRRISSGVYDEFKHIIARHSDVVSRIDPDKVPDSLRGFKLIPILLSGDRTTSTPEQIKFLKDIDFTNISVDKNNDGNLRIVSGNEGIFNNHIKKICELLKGVRSVNADDYDSNTEEVKKKLFIDTKATTATPFEIPGFIDEIFVEISAFRNISNQLSYFLIGRKGSGKSTIAGVLSAIHKEKYNAVIAIRAEEINLNHAHSFLSDSLKSDIVNIIRYNRFFELTWHGFIRLCLANEIQSLLTNRKLVDEQLNSAKIISSFIDRYMSGRDRENVVSSFFSHAFQKTSEFVEQAIKDARKGSFSSDLELSLNINDYLMYIFDKEVYESLRTVVKQCRKRVLVTLDDFDTIFDTFRRGANDGKLDEIIDFEQNWLKSLLLLIMDMKKSPRGKSEFFIPFDFCVTIPKDRYTEIVKNDRDGYRYNQNVNTLNWTGVQLCEMLRKRVERLTKTTSNPLNLEHNRLKEVIEKGLPGIPPNLNFEFNGSTVNIDTFLYILRHTLWRPRGVLHYLTGILAATGLNGNQVKISQTSLREIISCLTTELIQTEFVDEYGTTIRNLREILDAFTGKKQVMSDKEIRSVLKGFTIYEHHYDHRKTIFIEQIELLYDIGFLGFRFDHDIRVRHNLYAKMPDYFTFNGGSRPLKIAKFLKFQKIEFLVNPLFTEFLMLNHSYNDFALNYDWDYIYHNHQVIVGSGNAF